MEAMSIRLEALAVTPTADQSLAMTDALADNGFFRLSAAYTSIPATMLANLAAGVTTLKQHGFPATFLLMYDEVWLVGEVVR